MFFFVFLIVWIFSVDCLDFCFLFKKKLFGFFEIVLFKFFSHGGVQARGPNPEKVGARRVGDPKDGGPKGRGPKGGGPKGGSPKGGGSKGGARRVYS